MSRVGCTVLVTVAVLLSHALTVQAQEKKVYGFGREEAASIVSCVSTTMPQLGAHAFYGLGMPLEEALAKTLPGSKSPAELEQRLRSVYAAAPVSAASWVEPQFRACLEESDYRLSLEEAGDCYLTTFFLSAQMQAPWIRRKALTDTASYSAPIRAEIQSRRLRNAVKRLAAAAAVRPPGDQQQELMRDLGDFMSCVAPDEAPRRHAD